MLSHDFLCTLSPNVLPKELRSDHPVVLKSLQTTRDCNVTTVRTNLIPRLIQEFKGSLGENPSVDSLIANWDTLKISEKYLDYVGCFLPWDPKTQAGPNARKFIRDQSEHPKTSHIYCDRKTI